MLCVLCVLCVYSVLYSSVLLELMGTQEQLDVNTITLNPIQTLRRPSPATISSDMVAKISLPDMQGFQPIHLSLFQSSQSSRTTHINHTPQRLTHTHTHTRMRTHTHTHTHTHTYTHTGTHTQSLNDTLTMCKEVVTSRGHRTGQQVETLTPHHNNWCH